jgi:palmitoyltransferase ZDHHC9/14/18
LGLSIGLVVYSLIFLILTAFTDPGIIPRSMLASGQNRDQWTSIHRQQDIVIDGQLYKIKFCDTCRIFRPPRAIHCSVCNNCVEKFDHHCPWVGTCIGKRNYTFFAHFVFSLTLYCILVISSCIADLLLCMDEYKGSVEPKINGVLQTNPASLIIAIYSFIFLIFVCILSGFHTFLICTGQTTNEMVCSMFHCILLY